MNIDKLKTFVRVVELGSISEAAKRSNISQPALSQQIYGIETAFGEHLLERGTRGVAPTEAGKIVYKKALEIISVYDEIFLEISRTKTKRHPLKIIATPVAYSYAMPCALYYLKNNHCDYSFEMETMPSCMIEDKIMKGHADMGIIIGKADSRSLACKKLFSDRFYVVAGNGVNIPQSLPRDRLYNYPFITLVNTQKTQNLLEAALREFGIDTERLHVQYTLDSIEAIKLSAINNYGLAFLPYMSIKKELYYKQLRIIDFGLEISNSYYSIKRQQKKGEDTGFIKQINYIEHILKTTIC